MNRARLAPLAPYGGRSWADSEKSHPSELSQTSMAEREGFEPPIGLHLCRISSAVHSTTLPPLLKAPSKEHGPCGSGVNRRGWRARQGLRGRKSGRFSGWTHDVTVMIGGDRGFRRRFAREWA